MSDPSEVRRLVEAGAKKGLAEIAVHVLEAAKRDVPVGDPALDPDPSVSLKESGKIELHAGGRFASVTFDTPYSAKQHEDMRLKHPRGGGPKFLEGPALQAIPLLEGAIASEVRKRIGGSR